MRPYTLFSSLFLFLGIILTGCTSSEESNIAIKTDTNKLTVYTTIYPLQDFTEKIGGEFVEAKSIYPPNVDAHSFEPSTKDMVKLAEADLFIYTGAGIEGFADKAKNALGNEKVMIVKAVENIEMLESNHDHSHEGEEEHPEEEQNHIEDEHQNEQSYTDEEHHEGEGTHSDQEQHHEEEAAHSDEGHHKGEGTHSDNENNGNYDPHVWLDPILSIQMASNIKDSLVKLMPEHEQEFEKNFTQLEKDLKELDNEYTEVVDHAANKHLLVAHEAYGYWSHRYGIIQIAVNGLSPTQEPSQRELSLLIEEAKEHNLKYIAFEQNVSSGVAEMIQKEIGAEAVILYNLESITDEDMKNLEDYFSLMRRNLETLKIVLN